jgi:hypothetical protein
MARGGKREGAGRKKGSKDKRPRSSPVIVAPAQEKRELREAAREFTDGALKTLAAICKEGQSETARVSAASALLDRGYGKPGQQVNVDMTTHYDRMDEDQLRERTAEQLHALRLLDALETGCFDHAKNDGIRGKE